MRLLRDLVCLIFGHRWTVDPLSAEHVCIRCGAVKEHSWTDHIDSAMAELRNRDRSPFEDRIYNVLRSTFGHER